MKTFIGLRSNKGYVKKTGKSQLYMLVGIENKFEKIPLDLDWPAALVDESNNQLLEREKDDKDCADNNLIIRQAFAKVNDIFVTARLQKKEITMEELIDMYYNYLRLQDFIVYMSDKIKERYRRKKITWNTKKSQTSAWLWLTQFKKQIPFKDLTPKLVENFEAFMQKQSNKRSKEKKSLDGNTIANVMKYVKAYINLAIKDEIPIKNPFDKADVKTHQDVKMIEHVSPRGVALLIKHYNREIPIGEKLSLCRWLIACHLSLRISDILKIDTLKLENYKQAGKIIFNPQKQVLTNKLKTVYVHIDEYAMKYLEDCVELQIQAKKLGLKITEEYGRKALKTIADKTGVKLNGFHMGRHTFATNYIRFGGKVTNLQYIMGHSNINTTMRYVHIVDDDAEEDMLTLSRGYLAFMNIKKEPKK
ncbi:MAG: hypothetical protein JWM28_4503 [Chitinophagaceae bacterium]|nr:hypothetical protein [Chitinophagaceae bacterium]